MSLTSSLMSLIIPLDGDPTSVYLNAIQQSLQKIDSHNHAPGNGAQIHTAGINIDLDLSFNSVGATNLQRTEFANQITASPAFPGPCLFSYNGDLYFKNGSNQIVRVSNGPSLFDASAGYGFYGDYAAYGAQASYSQSSKQYTLNDHTGAEAVLNILGLNVGTLGISSNGAISGASLNVGSGGITGGAGNFASVAASGPVTASSNSVNQVVASSAAGNAFLQANAAAAHNAGVDLKNSVQEWQLVTDSSGNLNIVNVTTGSVTVAQITPLDLFAMNVPFQLAQFVNGGSTIEIATAFKVNGAMYYDTTNSRVRVYIGGTWKTVTAA